jgi:hypothetical protein
MIRDAFVKKIAHRIDEDHSRRLPFQRLGKFLWDKAKVESLLEGMAGDATKPFGEGFGVAVRATWADRNCLPPQQGDGEGGGWERVLIR